MIPRPGEGLSENGPRLHDSLVDLPAVFCKLPGLAPPSCERTACFAQGRVIGHVGLESITYGGSLVVLRASDNTTS